MGDFDRALSVNEMPKNLAIAKKLLANKMDVYLVPNPNSSVSADFAVLRKNKVFYLEGKTLNGKNSLNHLFEKGATQSERICVDVIGTDNTNYISEQVEKAFQKSGSLKEILLLKGTRLIKVDRRIVSSNNFKSDFRKIWERSK
jgi:hypothetical protein